jgi:hypothetical protein
VVRQLGANDRSRLLIEQLLDTLHLLPPSTPACGATHTDASHTTGPSRQVGTVLSEPTHPTASGDEGRGGASARGRLPQQQAHQRPVTSAVGSAWGAHGSASPATRSSMQSMMADDIRRDASSKQASMGWSEALPRVPSGQDLASTVTRPVAHTWQQPAANSSAASSQQQQTLLTAVGGAPPPPQHAQRGGQGTTSAPNLWQTTNKAMGGVHASLHPDGRK